MALIPIAEAEIDRLIVGDVGFGDLTTRTLGISGQPGRISFAAAIRWSPVRRKKRRAF